MLSLNHRIAWRYLWNAFAIRVCTIQHVHPLCCKYSYFVCHILATAPERLTAQLCIGNKHTVLLGTRSWLCSRESACPSIASRDCSNMCVHNCAAQEMEPECCIDNVGVWLSCLAENPYNSAEVQEEERKEASGCCGLLGHKCNSPLLRQKCAAPSGAASRR